LPDLLTFCCGNAVLAFNPDKYPPLTVCEQIFFVFVNTLKRVVFLLFTWRSAQHPKVDLSENELAKKATIALW
jgi:hypothetical protein